MKLVINKNYGGFGYGCKGNCKAIACMFEEERNAPELVEMVEAMPELCGDLRIVEIPDTATDYNIDEYDGFESVVYVVNGKLHWA
jgi:hypothetical protein